MPEVRVRKIFRLNEERLIWGILPTPWMIGLGAGVGMLFVFKQPKGVGDLLTIALVIAAITVAVVSVHRVSRMKVIPHWIKWHDVGLGGMIGRDLNPLPHRYQVMSEEDEAWFREQRKRDAQRGSEYRRQLQALRKDEAMRSRKPVGRR